MDCSEIDLDSPAIRALGSLFKLTEVFISDDGYSFDNPQASSFPKHIRFKYDGDDDDADSGGKISSNTSLGTAGQYLFSNLNSVLTEDADLTQQMSALGLPLSFQTSKKRSGQTKVKSKPHKNQHSERRSDNQMQASCRVGEETQSHADSQDKSKNSSSSSLPDQTELSCSSSDISDDILRSSSIFCVGEKPANLASEPAVALPEDIPDHDLLETDLHTEAEMMSTDAPTSANDSLEQHEQEMDITLTEKFNTEGSQLGSSFMQPVHLVPSVSIEQTQVAELCEESQNMMKIGYDDNYDATCCATCGDWSAFWDSFYTRYYFYNVKTHDSTWYPPPGMENLASGDISCISTESNPEVFRREGEKIDRDESGDKKRLDEQTGEKISVPQGPTAAYLSSSPGVLSDGTNMSIVNANCQDKISLRSLLRTVEYSHGWKEETRLADCVDILSGGLQSKGLDSLGHTGLFDSSCENACRNCGSDVIAQLSIASSFTSAVKAHDDFLKHIHLEEGECIADDFDMQDMGSPCKRKKTRKNRRSKKSFNHNEDHDFQPIEESYVDITKYWCQRYLLFSRYDHGIKMDDEGWFSVTPEAIARHQASRAAGGIIVDCFAGVGGNAIQFANTNKHVIAIDIDPKKIDYAHHNSNIYGVEDRIDFITGDSLSMAQKLKVDTVFLSPPWGGPDYVKVKSYDISMLQPYDGHLLFNALKEVASMIIMFLPRNVNLVQLAELSLSADPPWSLEVEKNYLNGKLKAVTAYFSKNSI